MKRFLLVAFLMFGVTQVHAFDIIARSSTTLGSIGASSQGQLCVAGQRGYIYKVIVSSASSTAGSSIPTMTIWNSSFTWGVSVPKSLGPIDLRTLGTYQYETIFSSGLLYTSTGTGATTLLYDCR